MVFVVYKYVHSPTQLTRPNHHFGKHEVEVSVLCSQVPKLVVHVLSIIPGTLQNSFFFNVYTSCMFEITPRLWNFRDEWGRRAVGWLIQTASFVAKLSFDLLVLL